MTNHRDPDLDTEALRRVVNGRLRKLGLSQRAAAEAGDLDVSASTLSRLARGKSPDLASYIVICRWLGLSLDTFVLAEAGTMGGERQQKVAC